MSSWEQTTSRHLNRLRLDTIRNKILMFAVLATLLPSLTTAWISYVGNKRALTEKASEELRSVSAQTVRELDLWAKERRYELRVFSLSSEVADNLERVTDRTVSRLSNYLNSVRERLDYTELLVVGMDGRVVASTHERPRSVVLPTSWTRELQTNDWLHGQPYWDSLAARPEMVVAVPIRLASGRFLGALAARVNLQTLADTLRRFAPGQAGQIHLIAEDGHVILTSQAGAVTSGYTPDAAQWLLAREGRTIEFASFTGERVLGSVRRVPALDWVAIAEIPSAEAFRQVARLRNTTLLVVFALLAAVGALAYFLGLIIVRPLDRLTAGAAKVAAGDLEVDLPVMTGGEVGYLTEVFNDMVARLREGRQELERLSVTDPLTTLYNRRRMMEGLEAEVRRSRRLKHVFAVVMADVDHFKRYNDAHGHLAGDDVLKRVARILREATRDVDLVARFGGEEFFVLMPETDAAGAVDVAERVRAALAAERIPGGKVSLSFGVAEYPAHGESPEPLMAAADAALYQAKREGRDRVVVAPGNHRRTP